MKKVLSITISLLLVSSVHAQHILNLLTGEVREGYEYEAEKPVRTVETLDDGYLVTWEFSEAVIRDDESFPNCVLWIIPGFMESLEAGTPALQYKINWLKIDDAIPFSMKIIESNFVDYQYQLAPAIPAQPVGQNPYNYVERIPINPYVGFLPDSIVKDLGVSYDDPDSYAGYQVTPFQYNYEERIIRAYTKIVYKVTLSDSTTGIEELKAKEDMSTNGFTLDGRPAKGNAKSVIVRDGRKVIVK